MRKLKAQKSKASSCFLDAVSGAGEKEAEQKSLSKSRSFLSVYLKESGVADAELCTQLK